MKSRDFFHIFGLSPMKKNSMKKQQIKIHEILEYIDSNNIDYYLPDKNKPYTEECLKIFLKNSISAYSAVQMLFGKKDYGFNIVEFPKQCAKFSNTYMTKCYMDMPIFNVEELYNKKVLNFFPIEWIKKHFVICEDNMIIKYNPDTDKFSIEKFIEDDSFNTCLSSNLEALKIAIEKNRVYDIYKLYI